MNELQNYGGIVKDDPDLSETDKFAQKVFYACLVDSSV